MTMNKKPAARVRRYFFTSDIFQPPFRRGPLHIGKLGPMQGDYALLEIIAVGGLTYFATFDSPLKRLEMDSKNQSS